MSETSTDTTETGYAFRSGTKADVPFVLDSWLDGWRKLEFPEVHPDRVFPAARRIVQALLQRPDTRLVVAHVDDTPDAILGYAVFTAPSTLHWVYVKGLYRGAGIGRALVHEALSVDRKVTTVTTKPRDWKVRAEKLKLELHPLVLWMHKGEAA